MCTEVEVIDEALAWLPYGLPRALRPAAVGMVMRERSADARPVSGTYDGNPHCWVQSGGFIFDATAGQFGDELPSVPRAEDGPYATRDEFPCSHEDVDMPYTGARRSFGDPSEAERFIDRALQEIDAGYDLGERY